MHDVKLPFAMSASVSTGDTPPVALLPDLLPPGWVRLPVTIEIVLPAEVVDHLQAAGAGPGSG